MINPEVEATAAKKSVEELIRVALVKAKIVSELNSQKLEQKAQGKRILSKSEGELEPFEPNGCWSCFTQCLCMPLFLCF